MVVARDGMAVDEAGLCARAQQRLSRFKCPKAVIVRPDLPKTATGKVQKARRRETYADFYR